MDTSEEKLILRPILSKTHKWTNGSWRKLAPDVLFAGLVQKNGYDEKLFSIDLNNKHALIYTPWVNDSFFLDEPLILRKSSCHTRHYTSYEGLRCRKDGCNESETTCAYVQSLLPEKLPLLKDNVNYVIIRYKDIDLTIDDLTLLSYKFK